MSCDTFINSINLFFNFNFLYKSDIIPQPIESIAIMCEKSIIIVL